MTNRELVLSVSNRMPADASLEDIFREIALVAGVNEAIAESDRGDFVTVDEARRLINEWTSKSPPSS